MDMVGNQPLHSASLGTLLQAGQRTEDHFLWLYGCWGCHKVFLLGQGLPVILQAVWMLSLGTGWPLHRQEGNSASFLGADLHQHPIAFYSCGIGCNSAPAVQLWVMLTRAQKEAAWDNGVRCTRVLFIATNVCCAGNSDPNVMVSMSSRSILCSPHLCVTHAETYIPFPRDNMNDSPLTFPLYSCSSSWDPSRTCCSLKWKGSCFPDVPHNCFICLWLAVPLPSKGLCTAFFEESISSIWSTTCWKIKSFSLLPSPLYFACSERKQKQNQSRRCSTVPVVQLSHGENLIYPPIVWATTEKP